MNRSASHTGRGRRLTGASAVGAVVALVSLAGAPGAFANDDYLEISLDGVAFSSAVSGPIFNESLVFVPGAATSASIWVRNNSGEAAWLSSAAVVGRSDPQLVGYIGLAADSGSGLFTRAVLGAQGTCSDIKQIWNLGPGEELELALTADLSLDAPNETMNRTADFDVRFLMASQDAAPRPACGAPASPGQDPGGSGEASGNTGSPDGSSAELVTLAGTGSTPAPASNGVWAAGLSGSRPAAPSADIAPMEQPPAAGIVPAGLHSTVEPIIRSLSGTLLIAMSVVFTAAVILRLRNRQVNE